MLEEDINAIHSDRLVAAIGVPEVEILTAGPPCQPFSKAAYGTKGDTDRMNDPRAATLPSLLRMIQKIQPRVILLENVHGIGYTGKSEGLDFICRGIHRINRECNTRYEFSIGKLNAADYGVPQARKRLFLIASRDGRPFTFPAPTHGGEGQPAFLTTWDAIGDLESDWAPELELRGKWSELWPSIPEGENYLWHTSEGGGSTIFRERSRYWNFLLKLAKDRPSWTITAEPGPSTGPIHWNNRYLSIRELCRLQTIPDGYQVSGSFRSARKQVGNAVPVALGALLAGEIGSQLLGHDVSASYRDLLPVATGSCPAAEAVLPAPADFRA